ncbi:hypothetical protein ACIRSU_21840 [Streptomyces sp. NPDC101160]|uniref:hypothetical protein n=1 Tax=Streptomyces sp. NPDC101160 TaxID=3366118 RepID=UPI00380D2A1D
MRPAQLRVLALGAVVSIAVLVPIAATAGPSGTPADESVATDGESAAKNHAGAHAGPKDGLLADLGLAPARTAVSSPATRCGPELASPDGVEAQTCVVSEGADTWARTYYRNATGQPLDAVLTLMAPAGRTVQVRCAVEARDEPGTCETPRERRTGRPFTDPSDRADPSDDPAHAAPSDDPASSDDQAHADYSAVAEFAGSGEGDSTPLLLRSGSNAAEPEGS